MALPHQLYAVVSRAAAEAPTRRPHRNIVELQREKLEEIRAKKAIDRASALLDRIAQRQLDLQHDLAALQKRQRILTERAERISDRIIAELEAAALTRADGFHTGVLILPSPAAVEILDAQLIPAEFMRPPKPGKPAPDKHAIREAIESGHRVPGCKLVQGVTLRRTN